MVLESTRLRSNFSYWFLWWWNLKPNEMCWKPLSAFCFMLSHHQLKKKCEHLLTALLNGMIHAWTPPEKQKPRQWSRARQNEIRRKELGCVGNIWRGVVCQSLCDWTLQICPQMERIRTAVRLSAWQWHPSCGLHRRDKHWQWGFNYTLRYRQTETHGTLWVQKRMHTLQLALGPSLAQCLTPPAADASLLWPQ